MKTSISATEKAALKVEVLAFALDRLAEAGPDAFRVVIVARRFENRGVTQSTIYRWVRTAIEHGKLGQAFALRVKDAATMRRTAVDIEPEPLSAAKDTLRRMPQVTNINDLTGSGTSGILDYLHESITAARTVMAYACHEDGKVRAAKMLLFGSEALRRCVETACRVTEKMQELEKVEEFHRLIMEEVRKESPPCARRILDRIDVKSAAWGAI